MSIDSRRIGREGEKRFSLLCTQAGATCNASSEDDFGWDKFVEFPPATSARPIDERPTQQAAIVQIKATRGSSRRVRISLDNALRLAKSSLPAFLVLVVIDDGGSARFYAVHVWRELIAEWLRAGREADGRGAVATNKEYVSLRLRSSDERGDGLLGWMAEAIATVGEGYGAAKAQLVDTLGYEGGRGTMTVTMELDEPGAFVDMQLGLRDGVRATRLHYVSERFGIKAGVPEIDEAAGKFCLTAPDRPVVLRLTFSSGRRFAAPARLRTAVDFASPARLGGWLLSTGWFEVVYRGMGGVSARTSIGPDDCLPADQIAMFAMLRATAPDTSVAIEVEVDGTDVDLGSLSLNPAGSLERWNLVAACAESLCVVAAAAARPAPQLSLASLEDAGTALEVLGALVGERGMRLEFEPEPGIPDQFEQFIGHASASVGGTRFAAVVRRPVVDDVRIGDRRRITFGPGAVLEARVGPDESFDDTVVEGAYARHRDRLAAMGELLAMGDMVRVASEGGSGDRPLLADRTSG